MKVGFIGLGAMGSGMAANLQKAGHELIVNDLRKDAASQYLERGARWADTARDLAVESEVVFTSLPTPEDVVAIGHGDNGLASGLSRGKVWFDLSTNSVEVVRRLERLIAERSAAFLDAPVSGGTSGAAAGKLAVWVGGDRSVFDRHLSLLSSFADEPRHIGPIGAGTIAKLVHNIAILAVNAVTLEALTMGVKAGVDPAPLWEAIRTGAAGRSRTFDLLGKTFLAGVPDPPNFELRLAFKDAQLALQLGREVNVPMQLCNLTALQIMEAINRGWEARDTQSFLVLQQERSGLGPFALPPEEVDRILDS